MEKMTREELMVLEILLAKLDRNRHSPQFEIEPTGVFNALCSVRKFIKEMKHAQE